MQHHGVYLDAESDMLSYGVRVLVAVAAFRLYFALARLASGRLFGSIVGVCFVLKYFCGPRGRAVGMMSSFY